MENASKALILAGAVIVAVIIVSLSVHIYKESSKLVEGNDFSETEIEEFNSKIEPYCGDSISGSQVNALINLVRSLNTAAVNSEGETPDAEIKYENGTSDDYLKINKDNPENWELEGKLSKVKTGGKYYKVTAEYNGAMRIKSIKIEDK